MGFRRGPAYAGRHPGPAQQDDLSCPAKGHEVGRDWQCPTAIVRRGLACEKPASRGHHRLQDEARWHADQGLCRPRSEEHTSELQSLMRISYAVFCLKKKNNSRRKCCSPLE